MDAVKFLKENSRMCNRMDCSNCPVSLNKNGTGRTCEDFSENYPEKYVAIVEKWSKEHPIKTRQSEFLKMFPNARMDGNGSVGLCPISVDSTIPRDLCYSKS